MLLTRDSADWYITGTVLGGALSLPLALWSTVPGCPAAEKWVHPGDQYRVGELNFTGATILPTDELRSELHMKPNSVFNTESVRRGIENIQKAYARKGHPNVTAIPIASVDKTNKRIALEIKVQEAAASQYLSFCCPGDSTQNPLARIGSDRECYGDVSSTTNPVLTP